MMTTLSDVRLPGWWTSWHQAFRSSCEPARCNRRRSPFGDIQRFYLFYFRLTGHNANPACISDSAESVINLSGTRAYPFKAT